MPPKKRKSKALATVSFGKPFDPLSEMRPIENAVQLIQDQEEGLGYKRVSLQHGATYKDSSTVILVPTRGMVNHRVISAWMNLIGPMNQKRAWMFITGDEVGQAYNQMISQILAHPELSKWKYVLTLEDDNLPPPDAHIRLLESIETGPFDAVGGLYWTKGDLNMPMAYGDPEVYKNTSVLDFRPRDIRGALATGSIMEVNGIAMGCSLYRIDLLREIPGPWFVTVGDVVPEKGPMIMTQDLYFCERARRKGKRFAVDMRVRVGHMDINTGIVY